MCAQIINSIGLMLDIGGVILLFYYGPPQPNLEEGVGVGLEDANPLSNGKTVAEHNEGIRKTRAKHFSISRFAIAIIAIGFILQLIATWV